MEGNQLDEHASLSGVVGNRPRYVAHVSEDGTRFESVEAHLKEVSRLAAEFARPFGADSWAEAAGLAHDIGKFSDAFQKRILANGPKVDHSTAGAFELRNEVDGLLSYCVAGHHGGLPNGGTSVSAGSELLGRLKNAQRCNIPDYQAFRNEIALVKPDMPLFRVVPANQSDCLFSLSFLTRMVYSCLVDADYLCTESFMLGSKRDLLPYDSLSVLRARLEASVRGFYPPEGDVNKARCQMLDDCLAAAYQKPGVFSLSAPTGCGKTKGLMRFALNHACREGSGMRRVICAIPYTSIIEQNAQVYREVLGDCNVLEHHSSFDYDDSDDGTGVGYRMRLAAENWDAPIVVTTNVQFFESLFASKPSRCRKLHNIAGSVILLDEAQMIPTKYLKPCVKALAELVKNYGCSVVLCTATQPCLENYFNAEGLSVREISSNPNDLAQALNRVRYRSEGLLSDKELVTALSGCNQALCIVNGRKQARNLYGLLREAGETEGLFHLTTMMYPLHRKRVLAEIRNRLALGLRCVVVATSLVEAGVDFDFPVVYRAVAGVDSIVQAAGRCNREGRRSWRDSIVHLFVPADSYALPSEVKQRAIVAQSVLPQLAKACEEDLDLQAAVPRFFNMLYAVKGERELDAKSIVERMSQLCSAKATEWRRSVLSFPFADVGKDFRLIDEGSFALVIPDCEIEDIVDRARCGSLFRSDWRQLSQHSVSLYANDIRSLDDAGVIESLSEDTFILLDEHLYREDIGLDIAQAGGDALFF